ARAGRWPARSWERGSARCRAPAGGGSVEPPRATRNGRAIAARASSCALRGARGERLLAQLDGPPCDHVAAVARSQELVRRCRESGGALRLLEQRERRFAELPGGPALEIVLPRLEPQTFRPERRGGHGHARGDRLHR